MEQLYRCIQQDPRHRDITTLRRGTTEECNFADWSMGFCHLGDLYPNKIPEGFSKFMLEEIEAPAFEASTFGQQMLLSFPQIKVQPRRAQPRHLPSPRRSSRERRPPGPFMYQLIYASTATREMTEHDLSALLEQARAKNERLEITGLLLYRTGAFIQVLEGEKETVDQLFSTIEADERHEDVIRLRENAADAREFPDWSMGFRHINDEDVSRLPGFSSFMQDDTVQQLRRLAANPSFAYEVLLKFKASGE